MIKVTLFKIGNESLKLAGKGIKKGAQYTYDHREEIKGGVIGAIKQTYNTGTSIYAHTLKEEDFEKLRNKIKMQQDEYQKLSREYDKKKSSTGNYKKAALDSLLISSVAGFQYFNTGVIPENIEKAYELAYPDLSNQYSLYEIIDKSTPSEAIGYINGIKGKLFELEYVDYLNNLGVLPSRYEASLAESATQSGGDIHIDSFGRVSDVWQLKAANDVTYVKDVLERYPNVDIVTTEEVYNQLAMSDISNHLVNSHISNDEITNQVSELFNGSDSLSNSINIDLTLLLFLSYLLPILLIKEKI